MVTEASECNYKCGTPLSPAFHYKLSHEDIMSKCTSGVKSFNGIFIKTDCSFYRGKML